MAGRGAPFSTVFEFPNDYGRYGYLWDVIYALATSDIMFKLSKGLDLLPVLAFYAGTKRVQPHGGSSGYLLI